MTEIYLLRHGQTDSNMRSTYLGHTDISLNDNGLKQAKKAANMLSKIQFDVVYTSPLTRAIQTAQEVTKYYRNIPLKMSYDVQERDYGIFDDLTMSEIINTYPTQHHDWKCNWLDYQIPDGESATNVQKRVDEFFEKTLKTHQNQKVLIVTHLGVARHMISSLLKLNCIDSFHFWLENGKYAHISVDDENFGILKELNI